MSPIKLDDSMVERRPQVDVNAGTQHVFISSAHLYRYLNPQPVVPAATDADLAGWLASVEPAALHVDQTNVDEPDQAAMFEAIVVEYVASADPD